MNDTLREYCSYWKFIIPLLKVKKVIKPEEIKWGNKDQYFLFFQSPNKKEDKLIIYIHGGGWNSNSPKKHYFIGQKIALEGYDCIMPNYRKSPKYHYNEIIKDIFQGYTKIQSFLKEKEYHYSKIVIMGSSAGAHLGAILCFDQSMKEKYKILQDEFSGLISMAGPLNFSHPQIRPLNILLKSLFGTKDKDLWKQGEPITKMNKLNGFKVYLIQSKHDGLVGYEQADDFYKKSIKLGMKSELYEVTDNWNTHSAYCVGIFLKDKKSSNTLCKVFDMIEKI